VPSATHSAAPVQSGGAGAAFAGPLAVAAALVGVVVAAAI
jgi:hypothetical protein